MSKFKADVRTPEFIHRNGKFQQFSPPGAVVMIKHEGVVLAGWGLSRTKGDKILAKETHRVKTALSKVAFESHRTIPQLILSAPQVALSVE